MKPVVLVTMTVKLISVILNQSLRVTLDKKVRGKIFPTLNELYDDKLVITDPGYFILEVKFQKTLPFWMIEIIHSFNLMRTTYSKYCRTVYRHLGQFPDRPGMYVPVKAKREELYMFRDFDTLINYSLSVTDITLALLAAMTCGLIIATLYKLTSRDRVFRLPLLTP